MLKHTVLYLTALLIGCGAALTANLGHAQEITSPRLDAAVERMAMTLDLSPETTDQLRQAVAENEQQAGTPGFMWHVAADVQASLTPEQKEELLAAAAQVPMQGPKARGPRGRGKPYGNARGLGRLVPDLTEEQRVEIEQIRASYADSTRTLRQQRRAAIAEVLTDEQEAALADQMQERRMLRRDRRADRRSDMREVASEVLDLTSEQQEALEVLRKVHREEAQALRAQVREGTLAWDEVADQLVALREEGQAARTEILTPEQLETVEIHRVLARQSLRAMRAHPRGHRGHRGGPRR